MGPASSSHSASVWGKRQGRGSLALGRPQPHPLPLLQGPQLTLSGPVGLVFPLVAPSLPTSRPPCFLPSLFSILSSLSPDLPF